MLPSARKILFAVSSITLIVVAVIYYSFYTGRELASRYSPLVDAAMEIKLEATTAHLWFEEVVSGDRKVDINIIWARLDQSQWYAQAMLDGDENKEGAFIPLNEPNLRVQIEQTIKGLHQFRELAEERWRLYAISNIDTEVNHQFDQTFLKLILLADNVETALQELAKEELKAFTITHIVLMVCIVLLGFIVAGLLTRYDIRQTNNMRVLFDREETSRITLSSIGDAVISTDTAGAVTYMNPVAEKLTGWVLEQAMGKPLIEVFNIIHAQTLKPVENPVEKVIETGLIVGLANHTVLIAKDATEYQIADSGAPICSPAGDITGVVLVFRDVTTEYGLHEELKSSELRLTEAQRYAKIGYWELLADEKTAFWSEQMYVLFGLSSDVKAGPETLCDVMRSSDIPIFSASVRESLSTGHEHHVEYQITRPNDGKKCWIECRGKVLTNDDGEYEKISGFIQDITERKEAELILQQSEERYGAIFEGSLTEIFIFDAETYRFIKVNEAARENIGYSDEELSQLTAIDIQPEMSLGDFNTLIEPLRSGKKSKGHFETLIQRKNGTCYNVDAYVQLSDFMGKPALLGIVLDITERKKAEEQLLLSSRIFTDTDEGITITDADHCIVDVNPAFSAITGYSREEVMGKNPRILSSGKQDGEFYAEMWRQLNDGGHWQGEIWNRKKMGEVYAELLTISSLTDDDGEVTHYVGVFTDITSSKQQQEQLKLMAHYDVLTGLPNRALFVDRFNQAIAHSKRTEQELAVCFLDLDNFKPVNDQYGHERGDELLIEVARRIQTCVREEDTISRQGGDEFALLLNDIGSFEQVEQTLKRIHHVISKPYEIGGNSHHLTISSGVTLYPSDEGDIDTLLRHADQAMYQAKQMGRDRYHVFNTEQDR